MVGDVASVWFLDIHLFSDGFPAFSAERSMP